MNDPVFAAICASIQSVLPEVTPDQVQPEGHLVDLGANSLDRADIVVDTMQRLGVRVSSGELEPVRNIGDLAELFRSKM